MVAIYSLKELPRERIFGETYVSQQEPLVSRYHNAYVTPDADQKKGGVFTADGYMASPALISRGRSETPFFDPTVNTFNDKDAVRLDHAVYGGRLVGHFGHFLLETLPRLTFLKEATDFPLIFHCDESLMNVYQKSCQNYLLSSLGISFERIVIANKTLNIGNLIVPWPAFEIRRKIHKSFLEFTAGLAPSSSGSHGIGAKKIFLSRTGLAASGLRKITNEVKIEQAFADYGFSIVHSQTLSFPQQIETFQSAEIVAGFAGSAFHNLLFCQGAKKVLYLTPEERFNANMVLIDKARGDESMCLFLSAEKSIVNQKAGFRIKHVNAALSSVEKILAAWQSDCHA